jgi:predicted membrane protein
MLITLVCQKYWAILNIYVYIYLMIKSRRMRWEGYVAQMVANRNAYRILVGTPERKRLLETPRRRWVDNIKMVLREIGWNGMDWIHLAQNRD